MNLQNKTKQSGFTIVELLIVIVVIAILAAITIVAYNGIQNRAKSSSAQALANNVSKKAEAYNTIESSYPTLAQLTGTTGPQEARLDNTGSAISTAPTTTNGTTAVQYVPCGTTGARIHWFDYANNRLSSANTPSTSITIGTGC
ncbi:type II secretion system protein [Candidatus Saccharibacteria bacterium]|nr:type II secretion system protein [Candidatus Saccharibacteria bacterium]